ncbi:MAG TPA: serine hydrolase domain-containing protein [Candidatus Acidoferrum sp.]|nr:serine hydrolase domain-containing protein [Candidatus Acidoferrum sp.]
MEKKMANWRSGLLRRAALVLAGCALLSAQLCAQEPKAAPAKSSTAAKKNGPAAATNTMAAASVRGQEMTEADLSAFLDGLIPQQIEKGDIAGAVVAVVKDGKVLFEKGYGYADAEKKTPVSPQDTLFRPGSISKTFTWTAVMQQVEQGKLNLDADVNQYLDFKIPPTFGKPTTLRDIMTHRSGFEETIKDLFVGEQKELTPMAQYLPSHLPTEIFAPGTIPAYSNYATTVAAYAVQRVSGQDFYDYVDEHFFKPLNMTRATFRQPLPESLKPFMSNGYDLGSGKPKHFEWVEVAPAGSLSASAESMAHWMIMHLQNGHYGDAQILKPETAIQMHARQEGWPSSMNAMCLGFYEQNLNGHRVISHGGDTELFHSDLFLILDSNVGLFVSYNSAGRPEHGDSRGDLYIKFMDRYFPAPPSNEPTLASAKEDAQSVVGSYKVSRRFETNILSVTTVLGQAKVLADPKDNTIYVEAIKKENGQPRHFREIAPMLFKSVDGPEKVAVVKDKDGRRLLYIDYPFMLFQEVDTTLDGQMLNYTIMGLGIGVVVLTILFWPVSAILRKHYKQSLMLDPVARKWRRWAKIACIIDIIYLIGFIWIFSLLEKLALGSNGGWKIHLLQTMGLLTGIGALITIVTAIKSWANSTQWVWYKIWNTLLAVGCVGFFWFLVHWHLLNFNLNY